MAQDRLLTQQKSVNTVYSRAARAQRTHPHTHSKPSFLANTQYHPRPSEALSIDSLSLFAPQSPTLNWTRATSSHGDEQHTPLYFVSDNFSPRHGHADFLTLISKPPPKNPTTENIHLTWDCLWCFVVSVFLCAALSCLFVCGVFTHHLCVCVQRKNYKSVGPAWALHWGTHALRVVRHTLSSALGDKPHNKRQVPQSRIDSSSKS